MVTLLNLWQGCSDLILQQMLFFWHLLRCESRWLSHSSTSDLPFSFLSLSLTSIPQKESVGFLKTSSIFLCVIAILFSLARTLIRVCFAVQQHIFDLVATCREISDSKERRG